MNGMLNLTFARRLAAWPLIQPITQSSWYTPLAPVQGSSRPATYPLVPTPAIPAEVLAQVGEYLQTQNTRAFLVMHKGQLVHRQYHQFDASDTFNSMSLVKTVLGIAIGIAIDKGLIGSVQTKAAVYLPEWRGDARRHITIEHLLTMQSGLKSDVLPTGYGLPHILPLHFGTNIAKQMFHIKAVAPAGKYFQYNNYNSQLLGEILERVSGMCAAEFFADYIWQPLECHDAAMWLDQEGGQVRTFAGLFAQPEDWLRVANLFLNQGRYTNAKGEERQIVSAAWLEQMIAPRNTLQRGMRIGAKDYGYYGYHVWLKAHSNGLTPGIPWFEALPARADHDDESVFYFEGLKGQFIWVSPKHELVVMRMGEMVDRKTWDGSYAINALTRALDIDLNHNANINKRPQRVAV
jgi:CubicO group peptidase (beta-lactamase class C family)